MRRHTGQGFFLKRGFVQKQVLVHPLDHGFTRDGHALKLTVGRFSFSATVVLHLTHESAREAIGHESENARLRSDRPRAGG